MDQDESSVKTYFSFTQALFIIIMGTMFLLLFFYINIQQEKYGYLIYFYGEGVSPGAPVLVRVISKDGEVVNNPDLSVNGKKHDSHLLELYPDLKEIKLKVGSFETVYPLKYRDIAQRSLNVPSYIQFSQAEIENLPRPPRAGNRHLFVVPETFRIVPEYDTTVHLYCVEEGQPCKDRTVFINGIEKELKSGHVSYSTVMTTDNSISFVFKDGTSVVTKYPFYGKQFKFKERSGQIELNSLIGTYNVHIDCYQSGKWVKTDIVNVPSSGIVLPDDYRYCDRIQASFNSHDPGGTFAVYTRSRKLEAPVADPYYSELVPFLNKFSAQAAYSFENSYNSSFFIPLTMVFSGNVLEEKFLEEQKEKLSFLWWAILFVSVFSMVVFTVVIFSRFKVVEGIDGELITHSLAKQKAMLAIAVSFYTIVIVSLLYLLKNLA
jgi:hypothetical protein